jgi:hypothetical protein
VEATGHFFVESDEPVMLAAISPSQEAAGIARGAPGGDPSFLLVPPIEQHRSSYVFLTPSEYAFDFIRIVAAPDTRVLLDDLDLSDIAGCESAPGDGWTPEVRGAEQPPYWVHTCQLSFPTFDDAEGALSEGEQHDGVHRVVASSPVGVLVDGFDEFVSYAYAGGTELEAIVIY